MEWDGVCLVRNLMYGFGDDRNPASDTVNVMEEILIEYIVDVVRPSLLFCFPLSPLPLLLGFPRPLADHHTGADSVGAREEIAAVDRRHSSRTLTTRGREETGADGGALVHAGGHQTRARAV